MLGTPFAWQVGCHEFYDHGLFAHGSGKLHHARCKRSNLDGSGESGINGSRATCDAIAKHVDRHCTWRKVGRKAAIIHFKGKGKPWKHINVPCKAASNGPYRFHAALSVSGLGTERNERRGQPTPATAPIQANGSVSWDTSADEGVGACVSLHGPKGWPPAVFFAQTNEPVPQPCCKSYYLQRSEWFAMARMAGLRPPPPIW